MRAARAAPKQTVGHSIGHSSDTNARSRCMTPEGQAGLPRSEGQDDEAFVQSRHGSARLRPSATISYGIIGR